MRKLIFIIALFFSTSLLAEVFNCEMILTSEKWGNQKYKLLVDTGDEDDSYLGTFDENGNIKEVIQDVVSIGSIYLDTGNPYSLGKINRDVVFHIKNSHEHVGIFYANSASTINITKMFSDDWKIYITDTTSNFDYVQTGVCE